MVEYKLDEELEFTGVLNGSTGVLVPLIKMIRHR